MKPKEVCQKWMSRKRNIRLLYDDIQELETLGYDVMEVQDRAGEYEDMERPSYKSQEDYQDAKDDTWCSILEAINELEGTLEEDEDDTDEV